MRTTLAIDDDVLDKARSVAAKLHTPFRRVVNEALRAGLRKVETPAKCAPYRTRPHKMGLRAGITLDNIQELLARIKVRLNKRQSGPPEMDKKRIQIGPLDLDPVRLLLLEARRDRVAGNALSDRGAAGGVEGEAGGEGVSRTPRSRAKLSAP